MAFVGEDVGECRRLDESMPRTENEEANKWAAEGWMKNIDMKAYNQLQVDVSYSSNTEMADSVPLIILCCSVYVMKMNGRELGT